VNAIREYPISLITVTSSSGYAENDAVITHTHTHTKNCAPAKFANNPLIYATTKQEYEKYNVSNNSLLVTNIRNDAAKYLEHNFDKMRPTDLF
jgi:hypothetical protein